jgi:hypothetical protein
VSVQNRCMVCVECTMAQKLFWTHPMERLNDVRHVESSFGLLEIVLVLAQDTCSICTKHTIGSEIILDAPLGTPR